MIDNTTHSLRTTYVQAARYSDGDAWFRIFGYGLSIKSEARVYSDRNLCGAVRWVWVPFVGRRLVRWLRPAETTMVGLQST